MLKTPGLPCEIVAMIRDSQASPNSGGFPLVQGSLQIARAATGLTGNVVAVGGAANVLTLDAQGHGGEEIAAAIVGVEQSGLLPASI